MRPALPTDRPCPACGGPLLRVRRHRADRLQRDAASGLSMRRYRCRAEACAWQGLLPRRRRRERVASVLAWPASFWAPRRLAVALFAVAGATWAGAQMVQFVLGAAPAAPKLVQVPAGVSHDGEALPARHPWLHPGVLAADTAPAEPESGPIAAAAGVPAVEPLEMKRGCAWGQPGRSPYRGSVEQALLHARLPAEVVTEVARRVRAHEPSDRLEIRTGRIHGLQHGREFDPSHMAMSFGRTLCLGTRVNFAPGHVEQADLYEVSDARGRRHAVMVPDVCGNVTVLGARGERRRLLRLAAGDPAADEWWVLATGEWPEHAGNVPEPGSAALLLAALAAALLHRCRRDGRGTAQPRS